MSSDSRRFDRYTNEQLVSQLSSEWRGVLADARTKQRQKRSQMVAGWKLEFEKLREEQNSLAIQGLWTRGPSDVLSIIGQQRRETYHSAMLAWLLDPLAPHGMGYAFLEAVLQVCDSSWYSEIDYHSMLRVDCEVARDDSRADIVVWFEDSLLVVENKVDALESERQCECHVPE